MREFDPFDPQTDNELNEQKHLGCYMFNSRKPDSVIHMLVITVHLGAAESPSESEEITCMDFML